MTRCAFEQSWSGEDAAAIQLASGCQGTIVRSTLANNFDPEVLDCYSGSSIRLSCCDVNGIPETTWSTA